MLRRHRDDGGPRYQMREKMLAVGDDYWIEDAEGRKVFKVDGKALRLRDTFVLEDATGNEGAKNQERKRHNPNPMDIERGGDTIATVHRRLVGLRDHLLVEFEDGPDMKVHGNLVDHEYEVERHGDTVARISKKWFRVRDTYGVEIAAGEDDALILAITVAVDDLTHD
jgi:uncharacterized protein YxjI